MAHRVKRLGVMLGIHMVDGELTPASCLLTAVHERGMVYTHTHTHTHTHALTHAHTHRCTHTINNTNVI